MSTSRCEPLDTPERTFTYEEYMTSYAPRVEVDDENSSDDATEVGTKMAERSIEILRAALAEK